MQAEVVGIKDLDFTGNDGKPVKKTQFFVRFNSENVRGMETGYTTWDEIIKGKPAPDYDLGEVIEVEYNKSGRLRLIERLA